MNQLKRYQTAKRVTFIGAFINAILGFIKLIGGVYFHSHALIADGFHSFSDLVTDTMVVFASKYGSQAADESHPYGHQRIETAATFLLALLLILTGIALAWHSITEIITADHTKPNPLALPIAIFSILANEGLYHYTHMIGKRIDSPLLITNAWHHRSDAASSIVVLIGLLGSFFGLIYFDAAAAILVGMMIIHMGFTYAWNSINELVDTGVKPDQLAIIESIIKDVDGVKKIHQLRSRMMGSDIFVDVHVLVAPFLSVSEGHFIAQNVHQSLMKKCEHVRDVTVHIDPEDDEISSPSSHLPSRKTLESLLTPLKLDYPCLDSWIIHYIDGQVVLDLILTEPTDQSLHTSILSLHEKIDLRLLLIKNLPNDVSENMIHASKQKQ
ncbi:MAG: cation diffusion facilitator family transporter [Legionellaceae bacterium]